MITVKRLATTLLFTLLSFIVVPAQQTVISGKLLGSDGKPMAKGNVSFYQPFTKPFDSVEASSDGNYQISTNKTGLFFLRFTGTHHQFKTILLLLEDNSTNIKLDVQQQNYQYVTEEISEHETPKLIIEDQKPVDFKKQTDGTYVAEVTTNEKQIEYQISGLEPNGLLTPGTQAEDYIYDGNTTYKSITTVKSGKTLIILDPKKLPKSNEKPKIYFETSNIHTTAVIKFYSDLEEQYIDYNIFLSNKPSEKELKNYFQQTTQKANTTKIQLSKEKDPLLRQLLLLTYLSYPSAKIEPEIAELALNEIPPNTPFWSVDTDLLITLLKASDVKKKEAYINRFLKEYPNDRTKAATLINLLKEAKQTSNEQEIIKYYELLTKNYNGTSFARMARTIAPEINKIKVGFYIPEFSINSLNDPNKVISNKSLQGKFYLIDFWATWCIPCIGEMDNLHKAYEKFKEKNFEILSISFDQNKDSVLKFRQQKWKMPWLNGILENGFESNLATLFEITAVPKPILVNPEGKIIAIDKQLQGKELDETLTQTLH